MGFLCPRYPQPDRVLHGSHVWDMSIPASGNDVRRPLLSIPVPTISVFYGIVIAMFFNDHDPPHIHARYAEYRARVAIATGDALDGDLPPRAARLVKEWAGLHRAQLEENWRLAEELRPLNPVPPLP